MARRAGLARGTLAAGLVLRRSAVAFACACAVALTTACGLVLGLPDPNIVDALPGADGSPLPDGAPLPDGYVADGASDAGSDGMMMAGDSGCGTDGPCLLVSGVDPFYIDVDNTGVYFNNGVAEIDRIDLAGDLHTATKLSTSEWNINSLQVSAGKVFFVNLAGSGHQDTVSSCPIDSCPAPGNSPRIDYAKNMASTSAWSNGTTVFFTANMALYQCAVGSTSYMPFAATNPNTPVLVRANASNVYWSGLNGDGVFECDMGCSSNGTGTNKTAGILDFIVDPGTDDIYSVVGSEVVHQAGLMGAPSTFAGGQENVTAVRLDASYVYWLDTRFMPSMYPGLLRRCPRGKPCGSSAETLVGNIDHAHQLAAFNGFVYYTAASGVWRIASK